MAKSKRSVIGRTTGAGTTTIANHSNTVATDASKQAPAKGSWDRFPLEIKQRIITIYLQTFIVEVPFKPGPNKTKSKLKTKRSAKAKRRAKEKAKAEAEVEAERRLKANPTIGFMSLQAVLKLTHISYAFGQACKLPFEQEQEWLDEEHKKILPGVMDLMDTLCYADPDIKYYVGCLPIKIDPFDEDFWEYMNEYLMALYASHQNMKNAGKLLDWRLTDHSPRERVSATVPSDWDKLFWGGGSVEQEDLEE